MNADWLDQLAPEHAPPPPGWWPPAVGWWVVAALLIVAVIGVAAWWRSPRRRLRRATVRELRKIRAANPGTSASAQAIQNLLRRYALAAFGAETVARLNGTAWLAFLAERGAPIFDGPVGRSLLAASYGADLRDADREAWFNGAETFVRRAKRGANRDASSGKVPARGRPT